MANFNSYIPLLLQVEGGYQANPDDKGNFNSLGQLVGTFRGISARFYEGIIKRPPSIADIKAITKTEAENLYRVYFWNKCQADKINNQAIANTIVDHHVNAGGGVKLAQQVLNDRFGYSMFEDNGMGPITLNAINQVNPAQFVSIYNEARASYYRSIGNATFLNGWLNRLQKFAYNNPGTTISTGAILLIGTFFLRCIN
ncbi:MAG: glycosyl hydrolase 108 family protein [Aequorivita sp.]|nr:glycosyl hydrolase 108 family protein [Aequorivita sp.]